MVTDTAVWLAAAKRRVLGNLARAEPIGLRTQLS